MEEGKGSRRHGRAEGSGPASPFRRGGSVRARTLGTSLLPRKRPWGCFFSKEMSLHRLLAKGQFPAPVGKFHRANLRPKTCWKLVENSLDFRGSTSGQWGCVSVRMKL